MSRSAKKGPFVAEKLYKKVAALKPQELQDLETLMRAHLHMDPQLDVINRTLAKYASVSEVKPALQENHVTRKF